MSLAGIYISARELQALAGLSDLQFRLYIVMRRWMDFGSGIVGQKRGVSWQSFREELYQEPGPGVRGGSPDRSAIRRAADGLERAGLIKFSDFNEKRQQLIFKCLLADTDKTARNKADRPSTRLADTVEANSGAVSSPQADTPKKAKADTPPSIRDIQVLDTSSSISLPGDDDDEFTYPQNIKPGLRESIAKMLAGIEHNQAQTIIDEFSGQLAAKEIKNPIGYLGRMINQAKAGEFQPQRALVVAEGRRQQEHIARQLEESKKAVLQERGPVKASSKGRGPVVSLTEMLKKSGVTLGSGNRKAVSAG